MLSAEESLEFIYNRVEELKGGQRCHEKAAYRALMDLTQRWAEPTDQYIDDGLEMAERIGQDLADMQRHFQDLQHAYLRALFQEENRKANDKAND